MPPMQVRRRRRNPAILVEVCVETADDAVAAVAAGAGRIELNAALALDGLSPSPGLLVETRRAVRRPLIAMARPRAGDFCYSATELRALRCDAEFALANGADGVAFGILTADRRVDVRRCKEMLRWLDRAKTQIVFHRAFDNVPDTAEALEQLIDLGVHRVMTSGGKQTAAAGAAAIAELVRRAAGRIEVLPAGGVRAGNAGGIFRRTGCGQLHTSARLRGGRMSVRVLGDLISRVQALTHRRTSTPAVPSPPPSPGGRGR